MASFPLGWPMGRLIFCTLRTSIILWLLAFYGVAAMGVEPHRQDVEAPRVTAPRLAGTIVVDGMLDEAQWADAARITGYRPYNPVEEGTLPGKTDVFIFYDDQTLFFGFHCHADDPSRVRAHLSPREDINFDDQVGIYLDTFNDDRQAFVFYINALGIQQDARLIEGTSWNQSWDAVFSSRGRVVADGFVVEVAIPFRSLRFPSSQEQQWGLILTRKFADYGVKAIWPRVTHNESSMLTQAATLDGIVGVASGKNLEIQPTLVTQWGNTRDLLNSQLQSPLNQQVNEALSVAPSLSIKYGLTSDLILDATINPDFSQVESDPDQLAANQLRALYFSETRPFFLEGAETLSGAPYLSLHTRTILAPLWGAKLTGKQGSTAIGFLSVYDTQPAPNFTLTGRSMRQALVSGDFSQLNPSTPGFNESEIIVPDTEKEAAAGGELEYRSRGALVNVARVAYDVASGSAVGVTLADKEIWDSVERKAYGYHQYGAVDANLKLSPTNDLTLSVEGNRTGMRGGEQLQGVGYFGKIAHSERKLYFQFNHGYEPEGFRSLTAYLPLVGVAFTDIYTEYLLEPDIPWLVYLRPQLFASSYYDPSLEAQSGNQMGPGLKVRFAGQTYLNIGLSRRMEQYSDVYDERLVGWGYRASLRSEGWEVFRWSLGINEGEKVYYNELSLGWGITPYASATLRPTPWFAATAEYGKDLFLESTQFSGSYLLARVAGDKTAPYYFNEQVFRLLWNVTFSQSWSLRTIFQGRTEDFGNGSDGRIYANVLLTYLPYPGTAAYLGLSRQDAWTAEGADEDGSGWWLFFKLSYLWRV